MPQFSYRARRRSGELVEGVLDVADRSAAVSQIERLGLFPLAVDGGKGAAVEVAGRAAGQKMNLADLLPPTLRAHLQQTRKPKLQELATFTHQLANLLNSGMTLVMALSSMVHLESKGIPASVARDLKTEVTEGRSLSDAMAKQPRIFSDLYINMVRSGEQSGSLVEVLRRMASHFQRFAEVQSKFTSALIYPALVVCVGIGLIIFFMKFIMPRFVEIFNGFGVVLPLPTRMLIQASYAFQNYWWLLIMIIILVLVLINRFQATASG
ncbi:MAG: type II secretion system F family protein, partial [Limisphaerales bacterium]